MKVKFKSFKKETSFKKAANPIILAMIINFFWIIVDPHLWLFWILTFFSIGLLILIFIQYLKKESIEINDEEISINKNKKTKKFRWENIEKGAILESKTENTRDLILISDNSDSTSFRISNLKPKEELLLLEKIKEKHPKILVFKK
jgi:Ca2+/Na+ antiporter